jgi:hypothetical protein
MNATSDKHVYKIDSIMYLVLTTGAILYAHYWCYFIRLLFVAAPCSLCSRIKNVGFII